MRRFGSLFYVGVLTLSVASGCWGQARSQPRPATGDVFSSQGTADDRAKYVSKDGRWFDRCRYDTDHMADNPYTKQYGPPDRVAINREVMNQYARCAVDACAVNQKALCWGKKTSAGALTFVINCKAYGPNQLVCEGLPDGCTAAPAAGGGPAKVVCDTSAKNPPPLPPPPPPPAPATSPGLPNGAVASGDPDAVDAGTPGFLGSFPKTKCGSFCYSYLWEEGILSVNPAPTETPNAVGHGSPALGDAAVVYRRLAGKTLYVPLHYAVYKGNGIFYQRNGNSSIEVVSEEFFTNFPNAIVRYVNPNTGK